MFNSKVLEYLGIFYKAVLNPPLVLSPRTELLNLCLGFVTSTTVHEFVHYYLLRHTDEKSINYAFLSLGLDVFIFPKTNFFNLTFEE